LKKNWSSEEIAELARLRTEKTKSPEIARLLNQKFHKNKPIRTPTAVIRFIDNNGLNIAKCREITEKKPKDFDATTQAILKTAKNLQTLYHNEAKITHEFDHPIENKNRWIGIIHSGDWHIEGSSVDLAGLEKDVLDIANYPNFYLIFTGDGGDYFMGPLASSQFDTTLPPRIARLLYFKFMRIMSDRVIALCSGDHEWFAKNLADFDVISDVAGKLGKKYLGAGGTIHIKTQGAEYVDATRHRYRFNSSYNPGHTCRQYIRFEDQRPDIVCIAHNHINYIGQEELLGKSRMLIRSGTRKISDRYMQKKSYLPKKSAAQTNVAVLATDHFEMRHAASIEEARDLIEFLNFRKEI
jgi:hypothetical protein